jgi:ribosome-binding protein aMBF1 (putative translation factor)
LSLSFLPYHFYNWATDAVAYFARKTDDTAMETVFDGLDDKEALQAIGAAIRSMRKERGISQEALSHLCQIDRSHMGRIERGERNVAILKIVRIGRALGCRPSEILQHASL